MVVAGLHSRFSEIEDSAIYWASLGGKTGLACQTPTTKWASPRGRSVKRSEREVKRVWHAKPLQPMPRSGKETEEGHLGDSPKTLSPVARTLPRGRAIPWASKRKTGLAYEVPAAIWATPRMIVPGSARAQHLAAGVQFQNETSGQFACAVWRPARSMMNSRLPRRCAPRKN